MANAQQITAHGLIALIVIAILALAIAWRELHR